ncbi:MAG: S1 RNA-binding domain-containing protein [Candidatus Nanoarchaeia archaeon]|nr:S1 RNA-binding domain-containing protein [Candidatus Nanoarchaeia archaeon]
MFYKKQGLPEESDLVICTVKKILLHSVFVSLDEYKDVEGMLHISEVAPGRIRNLRDYVIEGKRLVCKVLKVDKEKKQIDISLRRVPLSLMKKKNEEFKQEQKAEKLLEALANAHNVDIKSVYEKIGSILIENYGGLYYAFEEIVKGNTDLKDLKVDEKLRKDLVSLVKEKIKLPEFRAKIFLLLSSSASLGLKDIKDSIIKGVDFAAKNNYKIKFSYVSAPRYKLEVFSNDYKTAEKAMKEISEIVIKDLVSKGGDGESQK